MTAKKKPEVEVHDLSKRRGKLKAVGGSMADDWNNIIANQTIRTLWLSPPGGTPLIGGPKS